MFVLGEVRAAPAVGHVPEGHVQGPGCQVCPCRLRAASMGQQRAAQHIAAGRWGLPLALPGDHQHGLLGAGAFSLLAIQDYFFLLPSLPAEALG